MAHTVNCIKLNREAEGLPAPPYPGDLGKRIYENVSKEAWQMWLSTPDHADQRIPPDPLRTQGAQVPGRGNGKIFLRRRLGETEGVRAGVVGRVFLVQAFWPQPLICLPCTQTRLMLRRSAL